jgi:LPS export ABC transporter protein LptC
MRNLLLIALAAILGLTACEEKIRPSVVRIPVMDEIPTQESWNTVITFSESGRVKAILKAGHIAQYQRQQRTIMDGGVRVDFYDVQEQHSSVLTSNKAVVNDQNHDLEARENVVVVSDSGTTLRTEVLLWSNETRKIHTQEFVSVASPDETLQGEGLESDQGLKNYKIFHVTGQTRGSKIMKQ